MVAKPKTKKEVFDLVLYIAGQTPRSLAAIANLQRISKDIEDIDFRIEVVDLSKNPHLAKNDEIVAVPTLVRKLPPPMKKIIGDLSNEEKVLVGLNLKSHEE